MNRHGIYYQPRALPCSCGSSNAYWHGTAAIAPGRQYSCPRCWLAQLTSDDPRQEEALEQVEGLYGKD